MKNKQVKSRVTFDWRRHICALIKIGRCIWSAFPGRPDVAHQKDEYMELDDLLKATAIYAQAIYELARVSKYYEGTWKYGKIDLE